jgi:hypothetical protein
MADGANPLCCFLEPDGLQFRRADFGQEKRIG